MRRFRRWTGLAAALVLAGGLLSTNQTAAPAATATLRVDLPMKPGMAEVLAVSGDGILASYEDDYRVSRDGGGTWQPANLPAACAGGGCNHLEVGAPDDGVVPLWDVQYDDDENATDVIAFTLDLTANTVGNVRSIDPQLNYVELGRGSRLLLRTRSDGQTWVSQVIDLRTGEREPALPDSFLPQDLTADGTVGWAEAGESAGMPLYDLALVDASGSTTVLDDTPAGGVYTLKAAGGLVFYSRLDTSNQKKYCVRDLSLPASSCATTALWNDDWSYRFTGSGVLAITEAAEHTDLNSGTWHPVTNGSFGSAVTVETGDWRSAQAQESGVPVLSTFDLTGSYLVRPDSSGTLVRFASLPWATFPVSPNSLSLTPTTLVGSDMRNWIIVDWEDDSWEHQTAWRRTIGATALGAEKVLTQLGRGYPLASGARLVEAPQELPGNGEDDTQSRVVLHDGDTTMSLDFGWFEALAMSGPYLLARWSNEDFGGEGFGTRVRMPDGEWESHPDGIGLFGSLLLEGHDDGSYQVTDLTGASDPVAFSLGDNASASGQIWGDWIGLNGSAAVYNYRTGQTLTQSGTIDVLGDGVAVLSVSDDYPCTQRVWNLAANTVDAALDASDCGLAAVGGGRVAYTTSTQIVVQTIDGVTPSAPRSLGVTAPATFDLTGDPWSLGLDITKALLAGTLQISNADGTVVRSIDIPATADGALRGINWDGKDDAGVYVPSGTYSFALTSLAADGSGAVVAVDGTSRPLGEVAVEGGLVSAVPTVNGEATVGSTLTADPGTWGPQPVALTYQWLRDGVPIADAEDQTYVVSQADAGARLAVAVTGAKDGYASSTVTSAETAAVPAGDLALTLTPTPTIQGIARVGENLTAVPGDWAPVPVDLAYQWFRGSTAITGADAATYRVGAADLGARLTVRVTGSKPGYRSVPMTSAATAVVKTGALSPVTPSVDPPAPVTDQAVSVVPGEWDPDGVALKYQWYRRSASGTVRSISGATGESYTVKASDVGYRLRVRVVGSLAGYTSATRYTAWTSKVATAPFTTAPTPTVTGVVRVAMPLTAVPGAWEPSAKYSYQWYRVGSTGRNSAIRRATKATYTPTSSDQGRVLRVRVTASRSGYVTTRRYSDPTVAVAPGMAAATPKVTGTAKVDEELVADEGTWNPAETTFGYQWYARSPSGRVSSVKGATARTYRVDGRYAGYRLKVRVTGAADGYASVARTSGYSSTVAKAAFTTRPVPRIEGTAQVGQTLAVTAGDWQPEPASLSYQWYRSGSAISGQVHSSYLLTAKDVGRSITVKVTARRTGYTSASSTSVGTDPVIA